MNFITQLGVLAVILIILVILIKSNQTLERIYMEEPEPDRESKKKQPQISKSDTPKLEMPKIEVPKPGFHWPFGKKQKAPIQSQSFTQNQSSIQSQSSIQNQGSIQNQSFNRNQNQSRDDFTQSSSSNRSQPTIPMEPSANLKIEILDDRGRVTETKQVGSFPYTIGRNEENDLELDDLSVSGYHAVLDEEDGIPFLTDCGSLNKLMVNGTVQKQVSIHGNIEVGLGNTTLRFVTQTSRSGQTLYYGGSSLMEEWH